MSAPGPDAGGDPFCDDPTHDAECDCGARPDDDYERRVEQR